MNKLLYLMGGVSNDSAVRLRSVKCQRRFLSFVTVSSFRDGIRNIVQSRLFFLSPLEITDPDGDSQEL